VIERTFPILGTPDLARALRFYVDLLGGTVTYRFPESGQPRYVTLRLGASSLGLGQNDAAPPPSDRFELCAYTKDVDAAIAKLRSAGIPILLEPADQPWGERMARVADPDGNRVTLFAGE
jgi:lactoylglutathione lyase